MKTVIVVLPLMASSAVAAEAPTATVVESEQEGAAQEVADCLPLRTPGIAESSASYNDYVKSRCRENAVPAQDNATDSNE